MKKLYLLLIVPAFAIAYWINLGIDDGSWPLPLFNITVNVLLGLFIITLTKELRKP